MGAITYVMSDSDIAEIDRVIREVQSIVNEPGWSQEQYERAKSKVDELVPLQERLSDEL